MNQSLADQATTVPKTLRLFYPLGMVAVTLPIFGGYLVAFVMLCWLISKGSWRPQSSFSTASSITVAQNKLATFDDLIRPIHYGVATLLASQLLAMLLAWAFPPDTVIAITFGEAFKEAMHLLVKWGLLWFVLAAVHRTLLACNYPFAEAGRWLCLWLGVLFLYCFAQRYTGIDWTHGFSARLGPHRYDGGVFRVSGFMGHPLSLAYNLMLLSVAVTPLILQKFAVGSVDRRSTIWIGVAMLAVATLLISGSRFPVAALGLTLILCLGPILWRWRRYVLVIASVVLTIIFIEGSILRRMGELFAPNQPLTSRFDRLVFWQVHWRLFSERPIFGFGEWATASAAKTIYSEIGYTERMYNAHNIFLQLLADSGLVGFAGLLALFIGLFVAARRATARLKGSMLAYGVVLMAVAAPLTGLLQNNFKDSEFLFAFWLLTAFVVTQAATQSPEAQPAP